MSMLETLQQAAKDKRERDIRLGLKSAQVLNFGNRVEKASQEPPEPVPQPLPVERKAEREERKERLEEIQQELALLVKKVRAEIDACGDDPDPLVPRPTIRAILSAVSRHYKTSRLEIVSKRRSLQLMRPRHVAMYLAKTLTLNSLPEIGRRLGGWDHSTVLHAVARIKKELTTDAVLAREVAGLAAALTAGASDDV